MMEGDSSSLRWASPVVVAGLVLGAVGLGLTLYKTSTFTDKKKTKKGTKDQSKGTSISSMLTGGQPSSSSASGDKADFEMKGYKTNSKGQKTTYFNRELSEEEKQLIGDITPKKIDPGAPIQSSSPQRLSSPAGGSAWNQAGTWEEKNVTEWAVDNLTLQLRITEHTLPANQPGKVSITSVQKIEGDATVSMIRGKKKYLYDLSTSVRWKLTAEDVEVTGDMLISEISADTTHEFCVQGISIVASNGQSKKKANDCVKKFVQAETNSLKSSITAVLQSFYEDMKTTF